MKRRVALLLAVCLFIGSPFMVFAAKPELTGPPVDVITPMYLNLGDSIAYGMSAAPGHSYFDRYARTLQPGLAVNIGVSGLVSEDLLYILGNRTDIQVAVASADIITISIGGNNLLRPLILAAFEAYGLDYTEYESTEEALAALYEAIMIGEMSPGTWNAKVYAILNSPGLNIALNDGITAFAQEWPAIMEFIRAANHDAHIKVLNLYNPVKPADNLAMHLIFEDLLTTMNGILNQHQSEFAYEIIDVYTAFIDNDEAVGFTLETTYLNLDPHPTTKGHQIIFRELMKLGNVRAFQPGKPEGVGKVSDPVVEELQVNNVGGLPAAHEVTGAEFGSLVAQTVQEDPAVLADHASSSATGLPAAHQDELGDPLSGYGFGQAVSGLAGENPSALVEHVRGR